MSSNRFYLQVVALAIAYHDRESHLGPCQPKTSNTYNLFLKLARFIQQHMVSGLSIILLSLSFHDKSICIFYSSRCPYVIFHHSFLLTIPPYIPSYYLSLDQSPHLIFLLQFCLDPFITLYSLSTFAWKIYFPYLVIYQVHIASQLFMLLLKNQCLDLCHIFNRVVCCLDLFSFLVLYIF